MFDNRFDICQKTISLLHHMSTASVMTARTSDGGATWARGGNVGGYRSGVDWVPFSTTAVAVGPNGTDVSTDGGRTWTPIGRTGFHSVQCVGTLSTTCWASGPDGMVGILKGLPKG